LDEIVNPWRAVEEKFNIFNEVFKFKVDINDFSDYDYDYDYDLKESSYEIPETVKKAKNIVNTVCILLFSSD
jgi:hypothetical protein